MAAVVRVPAGSKNGTETRPFWKARTGASFYGLNFFETGS